MHSGASLDTLHFLTNHKLLRYFLQLLVSLTCYTQAYDLS